jgi:hypothetical protein
MSYSCYERSVIELKPTIEMIGKLCTAESFERGLAYLEEGRVKNLRMSGKKVTSTVEGTHRYLVEVDLEKDLVATCSCPYDLEGYCKHIAATLIALSRNYEKIRDAGGRSESKINKVLDSIGIERLKDFLEIEFEKNDALKTHFLIYATGKGEDEKSVEDYKKEVSMLYGSVAGRHGYIEYGNEIDFSLIEDIAERYSEKGNFMEAAKIYQAVSEAIAENMDSVDDSDGYYGGEFDQAIEGFVSCLKSATLQHEAKRKYIDYLFRKYMQNDPDYFEENYDSALKDLCTMKEDLLYWKELFSPHLPDSLPDYHPGDSSRNWTEHYKAERLLFVEEFILDALANGGDGSSKGQLYQLFEKYSLKDSGLCILHAERLEKDGRVDEAVRIAEKGLSRFPAHLATGLRHFLNKHYELGDLEKYKQNVMILFFQEMDWTHYENLKKICEESEWRGKILPAIIRHFSSTREREYGEHMTIIDIYLREKMRDEAAREVLARRSLYVLGRYYKELSSKYASIVSLTDTGLSSRVTTCLSPVAP